jgi:FKBP-type peptidyl-prolyl cis-trans isomerase FkpA
MQLVKQVLPVLSVATILVACNSVDFKKTKSGVPYKVFENKNGQKILNGNIVSFNVIQKSKDSTFYSSYNVGMPEFTQIQPGASSNMYADIRGNIMELLPRLKEGDSVYMVQAADSIISKDPNIGKELHIKKGDQIITTFRVQKVYKSVADAQADFNKLRLATADKMEKAQLQKFNTDPEVQQQLKKDDQEIETYLAAHNIKAEKTPWGTYVQVINPGAGPKPETGKFSMVRYSGSNLNGEVFDSNDKPNQPAMPVQVGAGSTIKGFDDGIRQLPKGAKAKLYIPSVIGYGANGMPPKIQPNEILVFDVQVEDITDQPRQQTVRPNIDTTRRK